MHVCIRVYTHLLCTRRCICLAHQCTWLRFGMACLHTHLRPLGTGSQSILRNKKVYNSPYTITLFPCSDIYIFPHPSQPSCSFSSVLYQRFEVKLKCTKSKLSSLIDNHVRNLISWKKSSEAVTFRTLAMERVDLVNAFAVVETRLGGAVICIDLTKYALIPYIRTNVQKW